MLPIMIMKPKSIFKRKKIGLLLGLGIGLAHASLAYDQIRIDDISFSGLHSVPLATAQHYLALKVPFDLAEQDAANIIQRLYSSELFADIKLLRSGHKLYFKLIERPILSKLALTGNSVLTTDKLLTVLHAADLQEGKLYNPARLAQVRAFILEQYHSLGYLDAKIAINITPVSKHSIALNLRIIEGKVAKITAITMVGNQKFGTSTLLKQLDVSLAGLFTFFTHTDRYTPEKLSSSISKLTDFYLDHGYLKAQVTDDVRIAPDTNLVSLQFVVQEDKPYYISNYLIIGQNIVDNKVLMQAIKLKPGDLCSKQAIIASEKALTDIFGAKGYLFVTVGVVPKFEPNSNKVELQFTINPGKPNKINHIYFLNNHRTNDSAMRRQINQFEAVSASAPLLEEARHRLSLIPFMKNITMDVKPVPGRDDLVDVVYKVEEDSSAQASLTLSYSMIDHFGIGLSLNQSNFFGTGNTLGINFNQNRYEKYYNISYSDPYYTISGISRDLNFYISRVNPAGANLADSYTSNDYGASVTYGIPLASEPSILKKVYFGAGYENTLITLTDHPSAQVNVFTAQNGRHFQQLHLRSGFSSDSRDKIIFPNLGTIAKLFVDWFVPVASGSLNYYQMSYEQKTYYPLKYGFIATAHGTFAYGNGIHGISYYPIFKHYYAGGFESVHGYLGNSLGPKDSNNNSFGGNILTLGSVGMVLPNFIADSLRTSLFVDAGNVFLQNNNQKFGGSSSGSGSLRYAMGVEADWISPIGFAIGFSYAKPLLHHVGDQEQRFQFSLGANLG